MAQRRHHYERAFETFLRQRRIPYVAVDEARKALLPPDASFRVAGSTTTDAGSSVATDNALKSFDFVLYGDRCNFLIDVKGRKVLKRSRTVPSPEANAISMLAPLARGTYPGSPTPPHLPHLPHSPRATRATSAPSVGRLESWVTEDDVQSLDIWQRLFGDGFVAAFVFVYWCDEQPPDGLFQEIMEYQGRWYALRAIRLENYSRAMRQRSPKWKTVDLARTDFERLSQPFVESWLCGSTSPASRV